MTRQLLADDRLYTATLNLIASLGAWTRFCLVPWYGSVVWTDACALIFRLAGSRGLFGLLHPFRRSCVRFQDDRAFPVRQAHRGQRRIEQMCLTGASGKHEHFRFHYIEPKRLESLIGQRLIKEKLSCLRVGLVELHCPIS